MIRENATGGISLFGKEMNITKKSKKSAKVLPDQNVGVTKNVRDLRQFFNTFRSCASVENH